MDIHVRVHGAAAPDPHRGILTWNNHEVPCALGRAGIHPDKREGDGATPAGTFPLRQILFRADRIDRPQSGLALAAIEPDDGWCDDPDHALYNRQISLPFAAGCEHLWRDDHRYDVIAVVGYNDAPPEPGKGSAIFVHLAGPGYPATEGCIALAAEDLLRLLAHCHPGDNIHIIAA